MFKNAVLVAITFVVSLCGFSVLAQTRLAVEPMPVIQIPYFKTAVRPGWEERGEQWAKWLACGVRFSNGSGTICYYDPQTKYAYVITVGHLFRGRSLKYDPNTPPATRKVQVFYHNNVLLDKPREYDAEILCYRNFSETVYDVALCRFKADWEIEWYAPIAPSDYKLEVGRYYHSTGCDGLTPVAHYLVKMVAEQSRGSVTEIITTENNPRGGRSGGGVMTDDCQLVFICSRAGGGRGYWSSLQQIYRFLNEEKEFAFLLNAHKNTTQLIPVFDEKNPGRQFSRQFVPLP